MMHPEFQAAEARFRTLRAQYESGALSKARFETALRDLMVRHEGRYWSIGAGSGKWFVADGERWVETPPPAGTKARSAQPGASATSRLSPARRAMAARWGAGLLVLGLGAFVLPMVGLQFQLVSLLGPAQPIISLGAALVGVVLLFLSRRGAAGPAGASLGARVATWLWATVTALLVGALFYVGRPSPPARPSVASAAPATQAQSARDSAPIGQPAPTPAQSAPSTPSWRDSKPTPAGVLPPAPVVGEDMDRDRLAGEQKQ